MWLLTKCESWWMGLLLELGTLYQVIDLVTVFDILYGWPNACDTTSIFSKVLGILYQILNLQCGDKAPFTMKLVDVGLVTLYQVATCVTLLWQHTLYHLFGWPGSSTCLDQEPFTIYLIYFVVTRHSTEQMCSRECFLIFLNITN